MHHSWKWGSIQGRNHATMQKVHTLALYETEEHVHIPTSSTSVLYPYSTARCYHVDWAQTKTGHKLLTNWLITQNHTYCCLHTRFKWHVSYCVLMYAVHTFLTSAVHDVSGQLHTLTLYPWIKLPQNTHWIRDWMDLRTSPDILGKWKNPHRKLNHNLWSLSVQHGAYTNTTTVAHLLHMCITTQQRILQTIVKENWTKRSRHVLVV
jgi:hypothetical protein